MLEPAPGCRAVQARHDGDVEGAPRLGDPKAPVVIVVYALTQLNTMRVRQGRGLDAKPLGVVVAQIVGLGAVVVIATAVANSDRGVPQITITLGVFLLLWTFVTTRTSFGRHIYAVGGSPEATRRAGISVDNIRIAVFAINGFMAGVGGIILVSRLRSVATNTGGGNLLLNIIAAAVIGGTSLFGGVGFVMSALLGGLIIASVENGMGLLGLPSGVKFVVNGLVLLDEAVAKGAALYAWSLHERSDLSIQLLDVLPMAIGIAGVDDHDSRPLAPLAIDEEPRQPHGRGVRFDVL